LALIVMLGFVPMDALASSPSMPGHDATHPFVMQQAATEVAQASVGALQPFTAPPKMPAVGGAGGPQREVFGFALASSLSDPTLGYPAWNFSLLSTVAFFGLHVQDDGTFANDSGLSVWNSSELTGLLTTAHSHGTKVVLTIIEQDFSPGTPHMCSALAHASTTIADTVAELKAKGADGVNVDYEGLNGSCGSSDPSGARHAFTSFAGEVRAALPAGSYFSVDTYASSAADAYGFFDIAGLGHYVDSFFVMAYDLEYSNYSRIGCSSFCLGPTAPLAGYYYNDTSTVSQYTSAVPASQVILGVPYYGRKSCVASPTPNAYPTSAVVADAYVDASGESSSSFVKPGSYAAHRDPNDPAGLERWDTWINTSLNCTRELYWDDMVSLAKKYDLVNRTNLRGVGIWNLNYGGGAPELWSTLNTYFECPVSITLATSETTTSFSLNLSSGSCAIASFDVQQYDSTFNQGWFTVARATAVNGAATVVADGYRGPRPLHFGVDRTVVHSHHGGLGHRDGISSVERALPSRRLWRGGRGGQSAARRGRLLARLEDRTRGARAAGQQRPVGPCPRWVGRSSYVRVRHHVVQRRRLLAELGHCA
jgi:spore germination protein YaaH